jgi:hypothetical protein
MVLGWVLDLYKLVKRQQIVVLLDRKADKFGAVQLIVKKDQARWCPWFCLAFERGFILTSLTTCTII